MADLWFSPVSSANKTDRHDIAEILLKVALNIITLTPSKVICQGPFCVQREVIVRFVDIGGYIVDHHCLNFLFIILGTI